jgi:hypothetical protein
MPVLSVVVTEIGVRMSTIISVVLGFVLTGLVANHLVQRWQQRNWLIQQRFLGHEKEYIALKDLADEIASLLGARIYNMQRLLFSLRRSSDEQLVRRVADYEDIVKRWNERLTSFYVRLPLLAYTDLGPQLESSVQARLQAASATIEELLYKRRAGVVPEKDAIKSASESFNSIQAHAINFNKELLRIVESRRVDVYYGTRIDFSIINLEKFSTWQLVKALFIRDINSYAIIRPTLDLQLPRRRR